MNQEFKEFYGKTVDEAISSGLEELGLKKEDAEIIIIEEGKKRLFGSVKAKVKIAKKNKCPQNSVQESSEESNEIIEENETTLLEHNNDIHFDKNGKTDGERAVEFLKGLLVKLEIEADVTLVREDDKIEINLDTQDSNTIIGRRGVILDSIQTLVGAVANTGRDNYKRVVVDCENYRENREESLKKLAFKVAEKAVYIKRKIKLEPMNAYERRIIHASLSDNENVTTQSEGKEPYRYIVIIPNNEEDSEEPAIPFRRENRGGRYNNSNYRKPYNRSYGRDTRRPYNRDGYRKPYNKNNHDRKNYNDSRKSDEKKEYNQRPRNNYKKESNDFFGTFLGNSKK